MKISNIVVIGSDKNMLLGWIHILQIPRLLTSTAPLEIFSRAHTLYKPHHGVAQKISASTWLFYEATYLS
jgi:hypothetical protein